VRALICSGFTKTTRFAEAEELGVRGFVAKPYTAAEMSKAIHGVLHADYTPL
jgi:DNA-binding NarL/FixJ family response regulator